MSLQALYNGLSGLFGFSKSLDNIGNNISNMNTPGFHSQSAFFENLADGDGTRLSEMFTDFAQGDIQQTGTATDVAIRGDGLFVLKDSQGNLFFTRAGHFQFNSDGYLVDDATGYRVQALNAAGQLTDFNIAGAMTLPPVATTAVNFSGNLATTDSTHDVTGIRIYDASGNVHALSATFTNNTATTPGSWLVSVKDDAGNVVGNGEIRFGTDGTLQAGYTSVALTLSFDGVSQNVAMSFGSAGAFSGTTQLAGVNSDIGAQVADGHGTIGLNGRSFDESGMLQLTYSNNQNKHGPQLALAHVADMQTLMEHDGALYSAPDLSGVQWGKAGTSYFGKVSGGSLELSNVDLTQELTEMIIVQRGYQASSRMLSVTNSMLQQLYASTGGRGG